MKLKVLILKKRQVIVALCISFVLLLSLICLIAVKSKETINNVNPTQTVYADLDGDKKLDNVYITTNEKNEYIINVQTKKGSGYTLKPDPLLKTFGSNNKSFPMFIDCKDLNNDSKQELIIQSSDVLGPLIHIYTYSAKNDSFTNLISGRYNIFASTYEKNTPIILLGKTSSNKIDYEYYTYNNEINNKYTLSHISLGRDTINSLASYISEDHMEVINTSSSVLSKIDKGEFLDAYLLNIKYKNKLPYECTYQVRVKPYAEKSKLEVFEVKIIPSSYKNNSIDYKVTNIKHIN